jgi:hypothetical protein
LVVGEELVMARLFLIAVTIALALAAAACGGGDDDTGSPFGGNVPGDSGKVTPGANIKGKGECEVKVAGDVQASWKGDGGVDAVGSDYWLSDDELRKALEFLATGTGEAKKKEVDEAMKKDPRFFILLINCAETAGEGIVSLSPSNDSKYSDIPFGPGEYTIASAGALGGAENPKEFGALFSGGGDDLWKVVERGSLKITKWDSSGIRGSFNFKVEEAFAEGTTPKNASVEGTFDFPCPTGDKCKR